MDELRESSLLFSLESLHETERERVQREAREAERQREQAMARVAEVAERRRVAEQREREAKERKLALEREREQLDADRLEAMKRAAVERARLEVESAACLVEAEQARKHQLALAELRNTQATARYRTFSWLSGGALLLSWAAAVFVYFGVLQPSWGRQEQHWRLLQATDAARIKNGDEAFRLEHRQNETLRERLEQLQTQGSLPAPGEPVVKPPKRSDAGPSRGNTAPTTAPRTAPACVDDGDPLNAELCQRARARR